MLYVVIYIYTGSNIDITLYCVQNTLLWTMCETMMDILCIFLRSNKCVEYIDRGAKKYTHKAPKKCIYIDR